MYSESHWATTAAWYHSSRQQFLEQSETEIANVLAGRAADESLEIEGEQQEEWRKSIELLQASLRERIPILREALMSPDCLEIRDVVLEYDFRRRGLRMDCLLLGDGVLFVIEFKRSQIGRAARDQVMSYAVNLFEFHEVTRRWCEESGAIVVPVIALTSGKVKTQPLPPLAREHSWVHILPKPLECDRATLAPTLIEGLAKRRTKRSIGCGTWLASPFRPSSSILDATLSLYGQHDVVAIQEHAAPKAAIDQAVLEIREQIRRSLDAGEYHVVFLSGAPGAGKTLVGLDLVMRGPFAGDSVFVTGNAPLVDVLNKALSDSYRAQGRSADSWAPTGYRRSDAKLVASAATYKVVKAHNFLGKRGHLHHQSDGRVLVFDEAQRTYEKGRQVLGEKLADHEADLILSAQRDAFPKGGAVVVALVGHNQAINRGERGIEAWLEAADRLGWSYSVSDETLSLAEFNDRARWATHPARRPLQNGHLRQSMRYYRNAAVEAWADAVLEGDTSKATALAGQLDENGNSMWVTRVLSQAKEWARSNALGGQRSGLIASGQARRLAAEGLFVDFKPDIATWMLAPTSDIRSSNALETVQNQYQIQGLELDYCVVCWDADLRRQDGRWAAYKLSGSDWQSDKLLGVAKNGYRVLLTRARKGMVVFVPMGDVSCDDPTRMPEFYDGVAQFLKSCGARELSF